MGRIPFELRTLLIALQKSYIHMVRVTDKHQMRKNVCP